MPRSSKGCLPYVSIAVCLVIAILCVLAPVDEFRRAVVKSCFSSWEHMYDQSEDLFQNNDDSLAYRLLRPAIKFFFTSFANCGKEIVFMVLVIHFYPTLKGSHYCIQDSNMLNV